MTCALVINMIQKLQTLLKSSYSQHTASITLAGYLNPLLLGAKLKHQILIIKLLHV